MSYPGYLSILWYAYLGSVDVWLVVRKELNKTENKKASVITTVLRVKIQRLLYISLLQYTLDNQQKDYK